MNERFAWLLAALIPLSAGCLDTIALADRSDSGSTDAPRMDGGVAPQDGGALPPDAPVTSDVPVDAPAALPYCPEEVDYNAAQSPDLRYRRAAFAIPPDTGTRLDPGATVEATGTWAGTRALETPIVLGCPAGDIRYACRADTVIRVRLTSGGMHELVVTVSAEDLAALTVGMPVTLRARASQWDGATPVGYSGELVVRRSSDSALMLAIATGATAPDVGVAVERATPVCRSRPEPLCRRVLNAYTLRFGGGSGARVIAPTEEAVINEGGAFLCRNRATWQRVGSGGVECADVTVPVTSLEIARQP